MDTDLGMEIYTILCESLYNQFSEHAILSAHEWVRFMKRYEKILKSSSQGGVIQESVNLETGHKIANQKTTHMAWSQPYFILISTFFVSPPFVFSPFPHSLKIIFLF